MEMSLKGVANPVCVVDKNCPSNWWSLLNSEFGCSSVGVRGCG